MWLKIKNDLINLNGVELIQIRDYKINIVQGNKVIYYYGRPKFDRGEMRIKIEEPKNSMKIFPIYFTRKKKRMLYGEIITKI